MRTRFLSRVAVVAAVLAAACAKVEKIEVTPNAVTLAKAGDTTTLVATAFDGDNEILGDREFTFASSNEAVASVDAAGVVTAVKSGLVTITATSGEKSAEAKVDVRIPAKLSFKSESIALVGVGSGAELEVALMDDAGRPVTGAQANFAVEDGAIAAVTGKRVTALAPGVTKVTAAYGSLTATANLEVAAPVFVALAVEPAGPALLTVGQALSLTVAARAQDGSAVSGVPMPTFASTNERVATVDVRGLIRAVAPGNADVVVTAGDKTATVRLTVR